MGPPNDFFGTISIIGRAKEPEVRGESVELIKLIPNIVRFFLSDDLLQEFVTLLVHWRYLISASFFTSIRFSHSWSSFASWPCVSMVKT